MNASEIKSNKVWASQLTTDKITGETITVPIEWHDYVRFPQPAPKSRWQRLKEHFRIGR